MREDAYFFTWLEIAGMFHFVLSYNIKYLLLGVSADITVIFICKTKGGSEKLSFCRSDGSIFFFCKLKINILQSIGTSLSLKIQMEV